MLRIRPVEVADAPTLRQIYAPYVEKTAITFEYELPSLTEFAWRVIQISQRFPYLVAEWDGEIVGYAYANSFKDRAAYDWSVELSVYVKQSWHRQGIGKALYQALEQELAQRNFRNLYACIAVPNGDDPYLTMDSVRFHESLGYTLCGTFHNCGYKFDRWYSMVWMEKILNAGSAVQPVKR